jgi:hypothetical protein
MFQRFIERYQIWRDEKRREARDKNPLNVLALVALVLVTQNAYTAITSHQLAWSAAIGSALLVAFLALYICKSRWAWVLIPTFGAIIILESPLAYLSTPARYPTSVRTISLCLFVLFGAAVIAYGFLIGERYRAYLDAERRYHAADRQNI